MCKQQRLFSAKEQPQIFSHGQKPAVYGQNGRSHEFVLSCKCNQTKNTLQGAAEGKIRHDIYRYLCSALITKEVQIYASFLYSSYHGSNLGDRGGGFRTDNEHTMPDSVSCVGNPIFPFGHHDPGEREE